MSLKKRVSEILEGTAPGDRRNRGKGNRRPGEADNATMCVVGRFAGSAARSAWQ